MQVKISFRSGLILCLIIVKEIYAKGENFDFDYDDGETNNDINAIPKEKNTKYDQLDNDRSSQETIFYTSPMKYISGQNGAYETRQSVYSKKPDETVVHKPSHIIVNRPPTEILLHHAPIYIKPSAVAFHRPGQITHRTVFRQMQPQKYHVQPYYVKIVKPIEKKLLLDQKSYARYLAREKLPEPERKNVQYSGVKTESRA